jgi:hypothetical protein
MAKFNRAWTVQPHDRPVRIGSRILTVTGSIVMPLGRFPRRMTVVRLADGTGAVYSAIPLDEAGMAELSAFARPSVLIVPHPHHRLDAAAWLARYPGLTVVAPSGARGAVEEAVKVDRTTAPWTDPAVDFAVAHGTGEREAVVTVRDAGEASLIVSDTVANVRHPEGLGAKLMARLFGFGVDRPRLPGPVRRTLVKDPKALGRQYREWAEIKGLARVIPAHGDVLEQPQWDLRRLAAELER